MFFAAYWDHLPILQWARANGCEWNEEVVNTSAEEGNLSVFRWAIENGCNCSFLPKWRIQADPLDEGLETMWAMKDLKPSTREMYYSNWAMGISWIHTYKVKRFQAILLTGLLSL